MSLLQDATYRDFFSQYRNTFLALILKLFSYYHSSSKIKIKNQHTLYRVSAAIIAPYCPKDDYSLPILQVPMF